MVLQAVRDQVMFIVVRPVYLGNIGSAARVLKNFGFSKLRFVQPPRGYKDSEARRMSVGAFDLLKASQIFDSLDDALKDINVTVGTTSGQQRDIHPVSLESISPTLAKSAGKNRVALVFGDERDGLTRSELERCHYIMTIPTVPNFPSLNVAQAMAICAYELTRIAPIAQPAEVEFTSGHEDDELFALIDTLLQRAEFSRKFNRANVLSELRRFYQRAHPTTRELDLLKGALHKINDKLATD